MAIRTESIFENLVKEVLEKELSLKLESDFVVKMGQSRSRFDLADLNEGYYIEVKHGFTSSNRGGLLQSIRGRFSAAFQEGKNQHFILVFGVNLSPEDRDYFMSSYQTIGSDSFRIFDQNEIIDLAYKHGIPVKKTLDEKRKQTSAEAQGDVVNFSIAEFKRLNIQVFVGGHSWEDENKLDEFISEMRWENGRERRNTRAVNSANVGDVVLMKSTYVQNKTSFLRIKSIGIIKHNHEDGHNLDIIWLQLDNFINVPGLGKLRNTFQLLQEKDYPVLFRELIEHNPSLIDGIIKYNLDVGKNKYGKKSAGESKKYWWFRNNDDEWDVRENHLNEKRFYSTFSENIGQRRKPENFQSLKKGELMLAFQKGAKSEVVSVLQVTDELFDKAAPQIGYKTIVKLEKQIPWENIRTLDSLKDSEVLISTDNLDEITEQQFLDILSIVNFDVNSINSSEEDASPISNTEFDPKLVYLKIPFDILTPSLLDSSQSGKNESSIIHNITGDHQVFLSYEKLDDIPEELGSFPIYNPNDPETEHLIEDTILPALHDDEHIHELIKTLQERQDRIDTLINRWNDDATEEIEFVDTPISLVDGKVPGVLGVQELAKDVHGLIKQIKGMEKGVMFGIFGKWGRGKTYLWNKIETEIDNDDDRSFTVTTFHAWKYQDTPASWAYLYEILADNYYGHSTFSKKGIKKDPSQLVKFWRKLKLNQIRLGPKSIIIFGISLSLSIIWYFAVPFSFKIKLLLSVLSTFSLSIFLIYRSFKARALELFKKYTKKVSFSEFLGIQAEIQRELKYLLKAWLGKSDQRILIFVDDIDRCREDKIIEIIDSLRVMLEEPDIHNKVVVIAAIDESILKMAIRSKYHHLVKEMHIKEDKDEQEAKLASMTDEYMDKLFLAGINLPSLTLQNKKDVLNAITKDKVGRVSSKNKKAETDTTKQSASTTDRDLTTLLKRELNLLKIFSQGLFASNRTNPVTSKLVEENSFEILEADKNYLEQSLKFYETATPRQIRILVYRYLLARKLLQRRLLKINLLKEWDNQNIGEILPLLIIKKTLPGSISDIKEDTVLDDELVKFDLQKEIELELDEILKLVVAY